MYKSPSSSGIICKQPSISKKTDSRNIMIEVIELNKKERIDEIARMLSGEIMEEEAYILAKKMIK